MDGRPIHAVEPGIVEVLVEGSHASSKITPRSTRRSTSYRALNGTRLSTNPRARPRFRAYQTLALETPLYIQTTCVSEGIAGSLPGIYDGTSLASSLANAEEDTELFGAMIDRYDPDNPVPRRPVEAGLFAVGVSTVVSFARALGGLTDPTGPAIMEQMETTGVQSLFLGTPVSFDCGEPILELASSLCSVQGHLVELDADGAAVDSRFFDPTDLFDTALSG